MTIYDEVEAAPNPSKDMDQRTLARSRQNTMMTHRQTSKISGKRLQEGTHIAGRIRSPSTSQDTLSTSSIRNEMLEYFNSMVKDHPSHISFTETWKKYHSLRDCFWHNKERPNEIEALFDKARDAKLVFVRFYPKNK